MLHFAYYAMWSTIAASLVVGETHPNPAYLKSMIMKAVEIGYYCHAAGLELEFCKADLHQQFDR